MPHDLAALLSTRPLGHLGAVLAVALQHLRIVNLDDFRAGAVHNGTQQGKEHREEDQAMGTSSHDDAEKHLEEDPKGLTGGKGQRQNRHEGRTNSQEDWLPNFPHSKFSSLLARQHAVLKAEVMCHVHTIVHDQSYSHHQIDHRDGVQVQVP